MGPLPRLESGERGGNREAWNCDLRFGDVGVVGVQSSSIAGGAGRESLLVAFCPFVPFVALLELILGGMAPGIASSTIILEGA